MARTILVEYLIEYHSSVLIKLDRRGRESERQNSVFFFTAAQSDVVASENLHKPASEEAACQGKFVEGVFISWKENKSCVVLQNISGPQTALLCETSHILLTSLAGLSVRIPSYLINDQHNKESRRSKFKNT